MSDTTEKKNDLIKKVMNSTEFESDEKLEIIKALMAEPQVQFVPYERTIYPYEPQKVWYGGPVIDPYKITCSNRTCVNEMTVSDNSHCHRKGRK